LIHICKQKTQMRKSRKEKCNVEVPHAGLSVTALTIVVAGQVPWVSIKYIVEFVGAVAAVNSTLGIKTRIRYVRMQRINIMNAHVLFT
ncbi:hypothetical protein LJC60_11290, partial [Ruminococcaceae bacterium OttesenSCG-928-D13]|nr:hypothetical protein [Ruminococcaceae bacterium OttesenSCG-928-D13]